MNKDYRKYTLSGALAVAGGGTMDITTVRDLRFIAPRILDPRDMTSSPRNEIFRTHQTYYVN